MDNQKFKITKKMSKFEELTSKCRHLPTSLNSHAPIMTQARHSQGTGRSVGLTRVRLVGLNFDDTTGMELCDNNYSNEQDNFGGLW
jgi:hypothetical protein